MSFKLISGQRPNLWLGKFDIFPEELFTHAVSTRHGGVSAGAFNSLNLGLHVEDDAESVLQNRRLFAEALGVQPENITTCQQIHGDKIVRVKVAQKGAGFSDYAEAIADTDALITNEANVPLMLFFADCTPILLADPVKKAVGLAHGGWKGTVKSIAAKTVAAMVCEFGSNPNDILAAIGPSIGKCCYTVGEEVAEQFRQAFPWMAERILTHTEQGIKLDLQLCNTLLLQSVGVQAKYIENAHTCTACNNSQFFSYRADNGKTGRIAALISVK